MGIIKKAKSLWSGVDDSPFNIFEIHRGEPDTQTIKNPETFYNHSLYLQRAIEKRAEVISSIDFKVVDEDGEIIEEKQEVLNNPCNLLSGRDLIKLLQVYWDIQGEWFIYKDEELRLIDNDQVKGLIPIHPTTIKPELDGFQVISYQKKGTENKSATIYQPEEIVWKHNPSQQDPTKPKTLVTKATQDALRAEIELRRYQAKIARSGGRLDSIISLEGMEGTLSGDQINKMEERYKAKKRRARESKDGTTALFTNAKTKVQDLSRSPKELDYIKSKNSILEEVSTATGVPKTILSSFDEVKFSNAEEARITFLKETIKPLADKMAEGLSEALGDNVVYEDFIPEDHKQKMERIQTGFQTDSMTINERREELGLEEYPGGDDLMVGFNKLPLEAVEEQVPEQDEE